MTSRFATETSLVVRHSRMFLSLDFPQDGEVLEPSGIQARPELDPRLKHSGVTRLGQILIAMF
jgi:hypothetical protein